MPYIAHINGASCKDMHLERPLFTNVRGSCGATRASTCPLTHMLSELRLHACDDDTLQLTPSLCNTLQRTATHCNTLQHTATHCNALQHTAKHCNTLQHIATHYNSLKHTATHCNTLQGLMELFCCYTSEGGLDVDTLQHTASQSNAL